MKQCLLYILLVIFAQTVANAQQVIELYQGKVPGAETWNWHEKESSVNGFKTPVVYNVARPTLTAFLPPATLANGTAVIIAPGGAFHTLSINNEGTDVAKWLNEKGVAAFVLKYRLVHSETDDPVAELMPKMNDFKRLDQENDSVVNMAVTDGLKAIGYVRSHAQEYNINPQRIGFMGFSAGGTVTMGTVFNYTSTDRPDFAVPVYPYMNALKNQTIPADAPPLFICAATDDQLGLASHSSNLYNAWIGAKKEAELHMYVKGGHGFGMRKSGIPTDTWIERFGDWMELKGLLLPEHPPGGMLKITPQQLKQVRKDEEERLHMDWAYLERYELENKILPAATGGKKRVVFLGSSRIENWRKYDSSFFVLNNYLDRGVSGQTSPQMLVRFRQDVINLHPSVVVILGGSNDIAENTGPSTLENIAGNIQSMVELAKAAGIRVVLCSELPVYDYPWRPGLQPAEKIVALNKLYKGYADRSNVTYVDLYSSLADERKGMKKELTTDGVHPNLDGYKIMEPLVQNAIAKALQKK